jgi:LPS-assembly protein
MIHKQTHLKPDIQSRRRTPFSGCQVSCPHGWLVYVLAALVGIAAFQLSAAAPAEAQMPIDEGNIDKTIRNPDIPWQLEADEIFYDQEYDAYVAKGNVLIYKSNIKLTADFVRFDQKNMQAYAEGDVVLTNGQDILTGSSMEMDLENQVGTVEDGTLFIKQNNYHLTGAVIKKTGEKTYTIDDATLTTCDGDTPDWKITGKKAKIREDGEGTAQHATLWARKMPVLYTPYFYYPARKDRQTGLLWPEGGHSDSRGWYYNQPFFWAIDKSSDATIYANYMSERGMKGGLEYRYYLDNWSKGTWRFDGFFDRKTDDGGQSSQDWGFADGTQDILRKNEDRYWLRGSHHQKLPYDIQAKLDVDLVSDQDYTREFKTGYMSWDESKRYFESVFSRDLDDYNDPIRTNTLILSKIWPKYSLNTQLRYDLDSNIRNSHEPDLTLQQLPVINFSAVKQRIAPSPFFYNLNSQYVYFWSEDGQRTQRLDAYPRLYLPLLFKPFITIEPSVGLRGTLWRLDNKEFGPEGDKQYYTRGLYDTRLDLFSEIFKVFRVEGNNIEAIKHSIRPRVIHQFIPNQNQDDLPNFDATDRIKNLNLLTYSLTNTLTSKSRKEGSFEISRRVDKDNATVIDSANQYNYNDLLRLALEQSYDINEAQKKDPDKPFSPIGARLDFFPGKYISLDANALWSVYDYKFLSHNIGANIWDGRGDSLSVDYRYTKESQETDLNGTQSILNKAHSITLDLRVKMTDRLRVTTNYEYNFLDNTWIQTALGINYTANCWSLDSRVVDTAGVDNSHNLSYEFKINLFGLGEFGI